ncbi:MAG: hypothetical protein WCX93_05440 [Burkholderiaceae bacterium]
MAALASPRPTGRAQQGGYVLLELVMAMLIAGLLAAWGMQVLVNRLNDAQAQSAAVWMEAVHKATKVYVRRYGPDIQAVMDENQLVLPGFADWRSPALSELSQAGLLSPGFPESTSLTGTARVSVWRRGSCPGENCMVEALVHGERPLHDDSVGLPDEAMIAQWLLAAQGQGGAVHARAPDRMRGAAFSFSSRLPDGRVLPAGSVGMAVTAEHLALWSYLRVRDQRDPDLQGRLSVQGDVSSLGNVALAGQLVIGAQEVDGEPCLPDGAVAHDIAGGLLVCRHEKWRSASRTGGGGYGFNSVHGCQTADGVPTANPLTGSCSCPWYATQVRILDSGPRPYPEGRQYAYLCIG